MTEKGTPGHVTFPKSGPGFEQEHRGLKLQGGSGGGDDIIHAIDLDVLIDDAHDNDVKSDEVRIIITIKEDDIIILSSDFLITQVKPRRNDCHAIIALLQCFRRFCDVLLRREVCLVDLCCRSCPFSRFFT